ncbi:DUF3572 family protein [Paracoccus sp. JM45]|uniref:DUF3572 family protein n=1 Tax=Paracoccus sp. JM45 TaxID=2283626 RepID=UPI000E6B8924|nr:DUF3572 family protein [Paracoccus sp. JM45]RJE80125.1 DUF3572 family protein [Paracoccus sp. JM45]
MAISSERAHELATEILLALAERPEELTSFLGSSGLLPADLRQISERPDIAVFMLDFVVENDERVHEFAHALQLRPQDIMAARTALVGPGNYGWESD